MFISDTVIKTPAPCILYTYDSLPEASLYIKIGSTLSTLEAYRRKNTCTSLMYLYFALIVSTTGILRIRRTGPSIAANADTVITKAMVQNLETPPSPIHHLSVRQLSSIQQPMEGQACRQTSEQSIKKISKRLCLNHKAELSDTGSNSLIAPY